MSIHKNTKILLVLVFLLVLIVAASSRIIFGNLSLHTLADFEERVANSTRLIQYFGTYKLNDVNELLDAKCYCTTYIGLELTSVLDKDKNGIYVNTSDKYDICAKKLDLEIYDYYLYDHKDKEHKSAAVKCDPWSNPIDIGKPAIYLYPEKVEDIDIKLSFEGELTALYPDFFPLYQGWKVTAYPDGNLIDRANGYEYSYLFWEGKSYKIAVDFRDGFVVRGEDTLPFLRGKLIEMGLKPSEYNDFIVFWMPKMKNNPYNIIRFLGNEYSSQAKLDIKPKPDSILRVFMVYKKSSNFIDLPRQEIKSFSRKGFAVVEWGGSEIK